VLCAEAGHSNTARTTRQAKTCATNLVFVITLLLPNSGFYSPLISGGELSRSNVIEKIEALRRNPLFQKHES